MSLSLKLCALGLTAFLSACASNPANQSADKLLASEPRSELVFLNIEEASGWVAYNCNPEGGAISQVEDYRVVVIRQKSGEIIYDSQIPLAADLCTHGFELSPEDPRLKKLGQNVDREIIEPLEEYQQSIEKALNESAITKPEETLEENAEENAEQAPKESAPKSENATEKLPAAMTTPAGLKISGMKGDEVLLELGDADEPEIGARYFLLTSPIMVKIPGTDESLITSDGEVTGLVEVVAVKRGTVRTKILSGQMPEEGFAEAAPTP